MAFSQKLQLILSNFASTQAGGVTSKSYIRLVAALNASPHLEALWNSAVDGGQLTNQRGQHRNNFRDRKCHVAHGK